MPDFFQNAKKRKKLNQTLSQSSKFENLNPTNLKS